jgi:hypothetical protein
MKQHPQVFPHVGLLISELPKRRFAPGCPLLSHPRRQRSSPNWRTGSRSHGISRRVKVSGDCRNARTIRFLLRSWQFSSNGAMGKPPGPDRHDRSHKTRAQTPGVAADANASFRWRLRVRTPPRSMFARTAARSHARHEVDRQITAGCIASFAAAQKPRDECRPPSRHGLSGSG